MDLGKSAFIIFEMFPHEMAEARLSSSKYYQKQQSTCVMNTSLDGVEDDFDVCLDLVCLGPLDSASWSNVLQRLPCI